MATTSIYANSVSPVSATPLDYSQIQVTWNLPSVTDYKLLRLVRNQYAYPETQEDGYILYEFDPAVNSGYFPKTAFVDGVDSSLSNVSLVPGQFVYYTVWLLLSNDSWVIAGQDKDIVAKNHGVLVPDSASTYLKTTHDKVMEILPRTYTSASGSPFDVVDTTSDLYKFLKGVSLTYDEFMTLAELTVPFLEATKTADSIVPAALNHLGLKSTSTLVTGSKKGLIQKAGSIVPFKGTASSLGIFAETFTGYNTTVNSTASTIATLGTNLMLSAQDSSFHKGGLGSWKTGYVSGVSNGNVTLLVEGGPNVTLANGSGASGQTSVTVTSTAGLIVGQNLTILSGSGAFAANTTVASITNTTTFIVSANITTTLSSATIYAYTDVPTTEVYSFKSPYRLAVTVVTPGNATAIALGSNNATPSSSEAIGYGIPISGGVSYSFSYYSKHKTSSVTLIPYISWFDAYGTLISTSNNSGTGIATTSSWAKGTLTATSPGYSQQAVGYGSTTSATTIILPSTHTFTTGNKVYIEDDSLPFNGVFTVASYTANSITITNTVTGSLTQAPTAVIMTSGSNSAGSPIITVASTTGLQVGQLVTVTSGSGVFAAGTTVLSITDSTHFVASAAPTSTLASATIAATIKYPFTVFKANAGNTGKETPAAYAMLGYTTGVIGSTYTWYLDCLSFAPASSTTFVEARSVDIYFDPSKVNYLIDPSFNNTGWSTASSGSAYTHTETTTLTGVPYIAGTTMGKVVTGTASGTASVPDLKTAAATPIVNNNDYYTFSIYIKGNAAYTLTLGLTDGVNVSETTINVTTNWQKVSVTLYVTSISTGLTPYIYGTRSASQTINFDAAQLEQSQTPTDYFDGTFSNQGAAWSGVAHASKTYLYINKEQKLAEFNTLINDWLPLNTPYYIRSAIGLESFGLPLITVPDYGYRPLYNQGLYTNTTYTAV